MCYVQSQKRRGSKDAQKPERKTQTPTEVSIKHLHQLVWGQMKAVSVHDKFELQPVKQFFCKDMKCTTFQTIQRMKVGMQTNKKCITP